MQALGGFSVAVLRLDAPALVRSATSVGSRCAAREQPGSLTAHFGPAIPQLFVILQRLSSRFGHFELCC